MRPKTVQERYHFPVSKKEIIDSVLVLSTMDTSKMDTTVFVKEEGKKDSKEEYNEPLYCPIVYGKCNGDENYGTGAWARFGQGW